MCWEMYKFANVVLVATGSPKIVTYLGSAKRYILHIPLPRLPFSPRIFPFPGNSSFNLSIPPRIFLSQSPY